MQEIWVKVEGIPPKYLSWGVMMRVATALGIPIDVDWHEIFRSFYRVLRLRVAVRDISKVPSSRVMEFGGKLYLLSLSIVPDAGNGENNDDGDDPGNDEAGGNVEKDKDVEHHLEGGRPMDTDQQGNTTPAPAPTIGGSGSKSMQQNMMCFTPVCSMQLSDEDRIKSKILGTPGVTYKTQREKVDRGPEENIAV
jgi:hypothetical protein